MEYAEIAAKRRKKPSAAKPQPKVPLRISRMKTLHTAFCIAIIRPIRAIRGKIFARLRDSDILQFKRASVNALLSTFPLRFQE
jgi:hypothetical protein